MEEGRALADEHKQRGNDHFQRGEFELAAAAYSEAICIYPQEPIYWLNRCNAYRQLQRWEEAACDSNEALKLDPANPKVHYSRAISLMRIGMLSEALSACEAGLIVSADNKALRQLQSEVMQEFMKGTSRPRAEIWDRGTGVSDSKCSSRSSSSSSRGNSQPGRTGESVRALPESELPCKQFCEYVARGDVAECQRMLEAAAVPSLNWKRPDDGNSALHIAAEEGNPQMVRLLLAAGADPEATNDFHLKPFALAEHGQEVERILEAVTKPLGDEKRGAIRQPRF
mmetsp:Transcript_40987/g.92208  ORF Transcript_40987/g.92208 Transcript_40987/m.92208 type:complete len:284 (-) Transcript_40987:83-934(-)